MSGIIVCAELRYRYRRPNGNVVWGTPTIDKQKKQSDRAFIKMCERIVKSHDKGRIYGTDIILEKPNIKYFNKAGSEISETVINHVR